MLWDAWLLGILIETVSKGGNLLLSVGPTARGTIDERAQQRLRRIAEWTAVNSRSIYGCTEAPAEFKAPPNSLLTYNPATKRLYIRLMDWPLDQVTLEGYAGKVRYAQLLNDASEIVMSSEKETTWISEESHKGDLVLREQAEGRDPRPGAVPGLKADPPGGAGRPAPTRIECHV